MMAEPRTCPICATPIRTGKLMCLAHWSMVPRELQRLVGRTWRDYRRAEIGYPSILALGPYRRARDAAIAAVSRLAGGKKAAVSR